MRGRARVVAGAAREHVPRVSQRAHSPAAILFPARRQRTHYRGVGGSSLLRMGWVVTLRKATGVHSRRVFGFCNKRLSLLSTSLCNTK